MRLAQITMPWRGSGCPAASAHGGRRSGNSGTAAPPAHAAELAFVCPRVPPPPPPPPPSPPPPPRPRRSCACSLPPPSPPSPPSPHGASSSSFSPLASRPPRDPSADPQPPKPPKPPNPPTPGPPTLKSKRLRALTPVSERGHGVPPPPCASPMPGEILRWKSAAAAAALAPPRGARVCAFVPLAYCMYSASCARSESSSRSLQLSECGGVWVFVECGRRGECRLVRKRCGRCWWVECGRGEGVAGAGGSSVDARRVWPVLVGRMWMQRGCGRCWWVECRCREGVAGAGGLSVDAERVWPVLVG
eukprot:358204-Chlamydomonas_euryale.AAC.1